MRFGRPVAATAFALVFASVAAAASSPVKTSVHLYSPFGAGGLARGVHVARAAKGYCWTGSGADSRSDAWRCFVGNYIYDPCFSSQIDVANYVVCPLTNPGSPVLRINLTKKLPPAGGSRADPTRFAPWTVKLVNGKWCSIFSGATGLIAGLRINHGCTGGRVLLGNPRRSTPTWTIFYAPNYHASQYQPVPIAQAWW
jgi:hypothetical protein